MGWSIGYDDNWQRDVGYGVPAFCDAPKCQEKIDRGISYVCGGEHYGGEKGCGLYFCSKHLNWEQKCPRCRQYKPPYTKISRERPEWIKHKLKHSSWKQWRDENPSEVTKLKKALETSK